MTSNNNHRCNKLKKLNFQRSTNKYSLLLSFIILGLTECWVQWIGNDIFPL